MELLKMFPGWRDHESSCNLSPTLWQTWCFYHFLFMSKEHDVVNAVDQLVVLRNVQAIKVPEDYIIRRTGKVTKP